MTECVHPSDFSPFFHSSTLVVFCQCSYWLKYTSYTAGWWITALKVYYAVGCVLILCMRGKSEGRAFAKWLMSRCSESRCLCFCIFFCDKTSCLLTHIVLCIQSYRVVMTKRYVQCVCEWVSELLCSEEVVSCGTWWTMSFRLREHKHVCKWFLLYSVTVCILFTHGGFLYSEFS